jgi:hypothetical protein
VFGNGIEHIASIPTILEVIVMKTWPHGTIFAWSSFLLIIGGFVLFIISYFLLPLYETISCFDACTPPVHRTAWVSSLRFLLDFSFAPVAASFALTLHYLPLLAVLLMLGFSAGFLLHPQRRYTTWYHLSWIVGISALLIALPFLFFFIHPDIGYVGMLLSYGLFYGGHRLFLSAHPELQNAQRR